MLLLATRSSGGKKNLDVVLLSTLKGRAFANTFEVECACDVEFHRVLCFAFLFQVNIDEGRSLQE